MSSINAMLDALAPFQEKLSQQLFGDKDSLALLEWNRTGQKLHILEPTFLLYLRWREQRKRPRTGLS